MSEFKKLHDGSQLLHLPNAWDAGSARLFESLGAAAIATTSAGVAWAQGYADNDHLPVDSAIAVAANVARVIKVPLSVDFENGYSSDPQQVARSVQRLINVGVAGINLEDGNDAPELVADKIRAIKQLGREIFVNLRTDVYLKGLAPEGERVGEVLKRAALYKSRRGWPVRAGHLQGGRNQAGGSWRWFTGQRDGLAGAAIGRRTAAVGRGASECRQRHSAGAVVGRRRHGQGFPRHRQRRPADRQGHALWRSAGLVYQALTLLP